MRDGKPAKYEVPYRQSNGLDTNPMIRDLVADPSVPLIVTEGTLKADSAVGVGLCAVDLVGVWSWAAKDATGHRRLLDHFDQFVLAGRRVVLAFDADVATKAPVHKALTGLAERLRERNAQVEFLHWPDDDVQSVAPAKLGLDDWIQLRRQRGDTADSMRAAFFSACRPDLPELEKPTGQSVREQIWLAGPDFEVLDTITTALAQTNIPPVVFRAADRLVYLADGDRSAAHTVATLADAIDRQLEFIQPAKREDEDDRIVSIPHHLLRILFDRVGGDWAPTLKAIARSPVFRRDGTLATDVGYDASTGVYIAFDAPFPPVPERPTESQVAKAVELLLDELLGDFPFADLASAANFVALLLSPLLRPAFAGSVPLFAIDANQPGSGKTLLADLVSLVTQGRTAALAPFPVDNEELRKHLASILLEARPLHVFDNLETEIRSGHLAAVLTSEVFTDRILGQSRTVTMPNTTVWVVTGNNISVGGDLARRTVLIRLATDRPDPHRATGFRHPNLRKWVRQNRTELLTALFVIARNWYATGCPPPSTSLGGGFDQWSELVGGALEAAGITGFLAGHTEQMSEHDVDADVWVAVLAGLHQQFPGSFVAADIQHSFGNVEVVRALEGLLGKGCGAPGWTTDLGKLFNRRSGRWYQLDDHRLRLVKGGRTRLGAREWRIEVRGDAGVRGGDFLRDEAEGVARARLRDDRARVPDNGGPTSQTPADPCIPAPVSDTTPTETGAVPE